MGISSNIRISKGSSLGGNPNNNGSFFVRDTAASTSEPTGGNDGDVWLVYR